MGYWYRISEFIIYVNIIDTKIKQNENISTNHDKKKYMVKIRLPNYDLKNSFEYIVDFEKYTNLS